MKYTLFFVLVLLCIIELNGQHHHHSGSPIKKSDKSQKSTKPEHKEEPKTKTQDKNVKKDHDKDKDKGKNDNVPKKTEKQKQKEIVDWLLSKKGSGYAYGSSGQRLTKKLYEELRRRFGKEFKNSTKKWMYKEVYDCSGLVMKALEKVGVKLPHGATSAWKTGDWKEKGDINHMPSDKVCILYRRGNDGMVHTGIYLGNGKVIEAKGADYGVVETSLKDGHWTDYAIPKGL